MDHHTGSLSDGNTHHHRGETNVGSIERFASIAAGAGLIGSGLCRKGISGWMAIAVGGALACHGLRKHSAIYEMLGITGSDATPLSTPFTREVHSSGRVTIAQSPHELYQQWRNVEDLVRYFPHVRSIESLGNERHRWTVELPGRADVQWETVITNDEPDQAIEWQTTHDSPLEQHGAIRFNESPGGRGTIVHLEMQTLLPGGVFGILLAMAIGRDPTAEADEALRRFKQWIETAEIATAVSPAHRKDGWNESSWYDRRTGTGTGTANETIKPREAHTEKDIDVAGMDSFPASDPPSFNH